MQILQTHAKLICPMCGGRAECNVDVPEPHWGTAEKMSDLTSEGETEIVCNLCQNEFSAYVMNSSAGCYITLDEHPDTEVSADYAFFSPPTDTDDWLNTDLPLDPYEIFISSHYHLGDILSEYGVGGSGNLPHSALLINRMVFTQQVSALEAYLGDTLIKRVLDSEEALQKLLAQDKDLKDIKLSLACVSKNPNIVRDTVKNHLQETLFHNLAKVASLYKIALNIDIWPSQEIKKKLFTAITYRHDCVHRDGRDKNGQELLVFTSEYVREVLDAFSSFAKHISESLR